MEYFLTDFRGASKGDFRKFHHEFKKYHKPGGFLRNVLTASELRIEGDAAGLQGLGADFLLMAAQRSHLHLYSGTAPGHFVGPFTEGGNGSIGDIDDPHGPARTPGITQFRYTTSPVIASGLGSLRPGSVVSTGADEEWWILGNTAALASLAERCFDLADEATQPPVELAFEAAKESEKDSRRLILTRSR